MTEIRTLLLTDVVDSTKLSEALGDARMAQVWAAHDRVARDLLVVHNGREIDKTDGFLLLFESVGDAAAYAAAYHRAIGALDPPLRARAGLHVGPVTLTWNAAIDVARGAKPLEVDGLAKPTAARVGGTRRGRSWRGVRPTTWRTRSPRRRRARCGGSWRGWRRGWRRGPPGERGASRAGGGGVRGPPRRHKLWSRMFWQLVSCAPRPASEPASVTTAEDLRPDAPPAVGPYPPPEATGLYFVETSFFDLPVEGASDLAWFAEQWAFVVELDAEGVGWVGSLLLAGSMAESDGWPHAIAPRPGGWTLTPAPGLPGCEVPVTIDRASGEFAVGARPVYQLKFCSYTTQVVRWEGLREWRARVTERIRADLAVNLEMGPPGRVSSASEAQRPRRRGWIGA